MGAAPGLSGPPGGFADDGIGRDAPPLSWRSGVLRSRGTAAGMLVVWARLRRRVSRAAADQPPGGRFRQYALSAWTVAALGDMAISASSGMSSVLVIQPTRTRSCRSLVPWVPPAASR